MDRVSYARFHEDPEKLHVNCESPRAYFIPFASRLSAESFNRARSEELFSLCGEWSFRHYPSFADFKTEDLGGDMPRSITVPSCWQLYFDRGYDKPGYIDMDYQFHLDPPYVGDDNPCGLYRRCFTLDCDTAEKSVYLNFEGVASCFYLWINGVFTGYSQVSNGVSEFDVTELLHRGDNEISVLVLKWCDGTYLEAQGFHRLSGIFREVYLLVRPKACVRDYYVRSEINPDLSTAQIDIEYSLYAETEVSCTLIAPDGEPVCEAAGENGHIRMRVDRPCLWSDEEPVQYTLYISAGGETIPEKLALRRLVIENGVVLLNNKAVKGRGVNRHDSHPRLGYLTPPDHMERDLRLMRRGNVNMIRTSHSPNDPRFMQLCEKYGMLVVNEADLEAHGMGFDAKGQWDWARWSALGMSPEWEEAYVDRARRLFERDKNRGCVVMWSLGNESGVGVNFRSMRRYIKERCPDAIVHYENSHLEFKGTPEGHDFSDLSDVESRMYSTAEYNTRYFEEKLSSKPFFLCEYVDSMASGDIFPNWDVVMKYDGFFGACIWEFTDNALDTGDRRYMYGGDFGDHPVCTRGAADGMVFSDRELRPGYYDMKQAYRQADASFNDGVLQVTNRRYFKDLKDTDVLWKLERDGVTVLTGRICALDIGPRQSRGYKLFDTPKLTGEVVLTVSFVLNEETLWAKPGYETAFAQFRLASSPRGVCALPVTEGRLTAEDDGRFVKIRAGESAYIFDKAFGHIKSIAFRGIELITEPVKLNIWRAPLYEDGYESYWKNLYLDRAKQKTYRAEVKTTDGEVVIETDIGVGGTSSPPALRGRAIWTFAADGSVTLSFDGRIRENIRLLPRIGLLLKLPREFSQAEYYGYGPVETYIDRHMGVPLGRYSTTADDNFTHYVIPQENGSHYGTLWAMVSDERGNGLFCTRPEDSELCFGISRYTSHRLDEAKHDFELVPEDSTVVNLDYRVAPIGPREYDSQPWRNVLKQRQQRFSMRIRPCCIHDISPFDETGIL